MKKRYLVLLGVFVLALGALYSLLSAAPFQRDRSYLELSVIARESDSAIWTSVRQGMEQAAYDLDAELRFVFPATSNNALEQRALLKREATGGADALIVTPADPQVLLETAAEIGKKLPLITMESPIGSEPCITADNAAIGRALADEMLPGLQPGSRAVLLSGTPTIGAIRDRLDGAVETLRRSGIEPQLLQLPDQRDEANTLLLSLLNDPPDLLIALEPSSLEAAVRLFSTVPHPPTLCGVGSSSLIVSSLEKGEIQVIAAQNDFAAGYLAVQTAVEAVRQTVPSTGKEIGFSIVRRETMYLPENQKLLFPFAR